MTALDVRGLRVSLPDGRVLIDQIDLAIAPGEVVVLLGGSRAGWCRNGGALFDHLAYARGERRIYRCQ
jgi:ABC-type phosphate/phosphonate transport system ATPase subunit